MKFSLAALSTALVLTSFAVSAAGAQGTLSTPQTPTVPAGRPVGQSTIIQPGVSAPLLPSSGLAGGGMPCSGSSASFGTAPGNAGVGTSATGAQTNGIPAANNQPTAGSIRGINPSVTPGVPGSC